MCVCEQTSANACFSFLLLLSWINPQFWFLTPYNLIPTSPFDPPFLLVLMRTWRPPRTELLLAGEPFCGLCYPVLCRGPTESVWWGLQVDSLMICCPLGAGIWGWALLTVLLDQCLGWSLSMFRVKVWLFKTALSLGSLNLGSNHSMVEVSNPQGTDMRPLEK